MPKSTLSLVPYVTCLLIACNDKKAEEPKYTAEKGDPSDHDSTGSTGGSDSSDSDGTGDHGPSGDSDSGPSDDGETDTATDTCGAVKFEFEPVTPLVMLVLDKSGSMMEQWDYNGVQTTRWSTLHNVVSSMTTSLDDKVAFGLELFPVDDPSDACAIAPDVEVAVAEQNASSVVAAMPPADAEVAGGTPARAAHGDAVTHLTAQDTEDPKVIILVTDGAANCVGAQGWAYDHQFNNAVADAHLDHEIPTYVVGIDIQDELDDGQGGSGVNLWDQLNDVAEKGGVPKQDANDPDEKFYNAADGAALQEAIDAISQQLGSCVIDFEGEEPLDEDRVLVTVDGQEIQEVTDCDIEDGWVWVNPSGPYDAVELCGMACDTLKNTGIADIVFGCPPID